MSASAVQAVASWIGLITGIVGIVLACVAILYAFVTNRRADQVNDATIRALAHIESDVDKLNSDVRSLIQDAWAKFVITPGSAGSGTVDQDGSVAAEEASDDSGQVSIDRGLTEELKAEIAEAVGQKLSDDLQQQLDRTVDEFHRRTEETAATFRRGRGPRYGQRSPSAQSFAATLEGVRGLSTQAQALLRILARGRPLTRDQYRALLRSDLGPAFQELRARRLLAPIGTGFGGEGAPIYGLPPDQVEAIQAAIRVADPNPAAGEDVLRRLREAGYDPAASEPPNPAASG